MTAVKTWGAAPNILAEAGVPEDQSYYRRFTTDDEKAVLTVGMRIRAAWKANDPDMFADTFAENGSLLMGDRQLTDREEIRAYMAEGFAGGLKGAYVEGWPVEVRFLSADVALLITEGGIVMPGSAGLQDANLIRSSWVINRRDDGRHRLVSHQSSPVKS